MYLNLNFLIKRSLDLFRGLTIIKNNYVKDFIQSQEVQLVQFCQFNPSLIFNGREKSKIKEINRINNTKYKFFGINIIQKRFNCIVFFIKKNSSRKKMHWPGIEPGPPAWQASILPLNHQCLLSKLKI
jgi:hypothetical protein